MNDTISRRAALDTIRGIEEVYINNLPPMIDKAEAQTRLMLLPPVQRWIPVSEQLPDELAEVNITWINTDPPSYYEFVKNKPMTGSAVYYKGRWYWYSAVCADYLKEYGFSPNDSMDDAIKVIAWAEFPEPHKGDV